MRAIHVIILSGLLAYSSAFAAGYLGWSFGMSKAEVASVGDSSRYYSFSNGDLGAKDEPFEGEPALISFYFGNEKLNRVMLILYMGSDRLKALDAWRSAYHHIKRMCKTVEVSAAGPGAIEQDVALATFVVEVAKLQQDQRHQMACLPMREDFRLWASVTRMPNDSLMVAVNYGEP